MNPTSDMSQTPITKKFRKLRFAVRFSRRYHLHIQQSYMRWGTLTTFIAAVSASGAFASLDEHEPGVAAWTAVFAATAAIASAVNLIIRPTLRALVHKELAERFTELERDMGLAKITERNLHRLSSRRLEIETKEPPTVASVVVLCQNEEAKAQGYGEEDQYGVSTTQRILVCLSGLRLDFLTEKA